MQDAQQASEEPFEGGSSIAAAQSGAFDQSDALGQWQDPQPIHAACNAASHTPQRQQHDATHPAKHTTIQASQAEQVSINVDSRTGGWVRASAPAPLITHQLHAAQVHCVCYAAMYS